MIDSGGSPTMLTPINGFRKRAEAARERIVSPRREQLCLPRSPGLGDLEKQNVFDFMLSLRALL
jgi:hypothetical protein